MRPFVVLFLVALTATAQAGPRQGGDTVADATVIASLPFTDTGTTAGYNDDYDVPCPTSGHFAADVVYAYTPGQVELVAIDLCGSAYDTRVWVIDPDLEIIACNDDYYPDGHTCGSFVSRLEGVTLEVGLMYHIVIDGHEGAEGEYAIEIAETPVAASAANWTAVRKLYH